MADRARRTRPRQISEVTDESSEQSASESEVDWDPRRADLARRAGKNDSVSTITSRSRRSGGGDDRHQSIKLTMKVAPSKLREVTRANEVDSLQDTLGGGKVIDGPRSRRSAAANPRVSTRDAIRPRYAEYGESEIDDEEEEEEEEEAEEEEEDEEQEEEDEEDAEEEDEEMNDFDEVGAEAEGGSDEEDVEMEDMTPIPPTRRQHNQPKPPKITLKPPPKSEPKSTARTKITVTPAQVGPLKSVEEQEMEDDPGDEEVEDVEEESSELSEDEEVTNLNGEDAEGEEELMEEEDIEGEEEELEDDDEIEDDSGDETPASGMATPDPNRLTKRQRGRPEDQTQLMALDMAPQQRKADEEKAMKKDEHARKRKELTKRKILEEKTAALNRLLKPQASKARGAAPKPETLAAAAAAAAQEEEEPVERADPLYTRWISSKDGIQLGVPDEWLGKYIGKAFGPPPRPSNGALVQEVD